MKIAVCIKQVPDASTVRFDKEKGTLVREGVESVINPFDYNAIEAGLSLRDEFGGEVTVVTMGPPQAQDAIREAISLGVDGGVVVSDRAFAGADTLATTYTLANAIRKIGNFDLVICGKQAVDGDTAQVGPGLAVRLGVPCVTCVDELEAVDGGKKLRLKRMCEQGYDVVEVELPALITVLASLNTPRVPSLKGKMRAKKAEIPMMSAQDIGADIEKVGLSGSPTQVASTTVPKFDAKREMIQGEPEEQVEALVEKLKEAGIL